MRIISGAFKGRRLKAGSDKIRPTSDRVRTSIFNILPHDLSGCQVLDLFAGAGSLGLEALSRNAEAAVFVDQAHESMAALKANLEAVGAREQARMMNKKASAALKLLAAEGRRFDLVFLDPPYRSEETEKIIQSLHELGLLEPQATIVAEHRHDREPEEKYGPLVRFDLRRYGDTAVSFFRYQEEET